MRLSITAYLLKRTISDPNFLPLVQRHYRPSMWVVSVSLLGTISLLLALPMILSASYRAIGMQLLVNAQSAVERENAIRAAGYFEQALKWQPSDPETYRALARSYLRIGQTHLAVEALEHAYRSRPESPLIQQELAQAYDADGQPQHADALWAALGMTPERMVAVGDEFFAQHNFTDAFAWYQRAATRHLAVAPDRLFKHAIAALLARRAEAQIQLDAIQASDHTFAVYTLHETLHIDGRQFHWITSTDGPVPPGTPLSYHSKNTSGIFWWSGQALAVLSIQHDGVYLVSLRLRHSKPAPVQMAVGADSRQIQRITLSHGDNSWETVAVPIRLSKGLHSIDLWFLNNGIVDGIDRDAVVEWVEIREGRL